MQVVLRYEQVVATNLKVIQSLLKQGNEIVVEAPDYVKVGWYHIFGDQWIPPESQRYEQTQLH
jgi:hypothetical protein